MGKDFVREGYQTFNEVSVYIFWPHQIVVVVVQDHMVSSGKEVRDVGERRESRESGGGGINQLLEQNPGRAHW